MAYQADQYLPFASMQYDPSLYSAMHGLPRQPIQPPIMAITSVTGEDGAKAYHLPPSSTIALFDRDDDVFYLKTTDDAGFPTIRTFKFEEVDPKPAQVDQMFVSRSEFDALSSKIDELIASLGGQEGQDGE